MNNSNYCDKADIRNFIIKYHSIRIRTYKGGYQFNRRSSENVLVFEDIVSYSRSSLAIGTARVLPVKLDQSIVASFTHATL